MPARRPVRIRRRHALWFVPLALTAGALLSLAAQTRFVFSGHRYGLFLLRGSGDHLFEVKDDLVLGDGSRLLWSKQLTDPTPPGEAEPGMLPRLVLRWNAEGGDGSVTNLLPDGRRTKTFFSRFVDARGSRPRGLFVGGALPAVAGSMDVRAHNESGMALFENGRWYHLWCNANEAIGSPTGGLRYPAQWRFLGSEVLVEDDEKVVLRSEHETEVDGVPLRIRRHAYFHAGEPFFKLGIRIANAGTRPARFVYAYGDEPWLGHFGSSTGNVGWTPEGLVEHERQFSGHELSFIGMTDRQTSLAVFLEWLGGRKPDIAYFSNVPGRIERTRQTPLASNEIFLGLEWVAQTLEPGESMAIFLAIGWARADPATGLPTKPEVNVRSPLPE